MAEQQGKSRAKRVQEVASVGAQVPPEDRPINITIRRFDGYEYHLKKPESVVRAILDPDVPDVLIEVDVPQDVKGSVKHRFVHTNQIAELDVHSRLEL